MRHRQQKFSFLPHRLISLVKALHWDLLPECTKLRIFRCNLAKVSRGYAPGQASPKVDLRHTIVTKLCPLRKFSAYATACNIYIYRTLQFIVFLTLSNLYKTSSRTVTNTSYKMNENRCVLLRVICTCDQCDSPFCALQLTALIKPSWCVLLYCYASLCHSLIVVQPSWTAVPCPTT